MARLAEAKGAEFDRLFLEGMIKHHGGALIMVKELFSHPGAGQESEIFAFASDVDADQRMEIDRMGAMLQELHEMRSVATRCSVFRRRRAVRCPRGRRAGASGDQVPRPDPRVGLKAGFRDAGVAARGMELVASLPKPEGFFDPKAPAGQPTPPERDPKAPDPDDEDAGEAVELLATPKPPERSAVELRELGPRVQRQHALRGQLPWVQYLRHRESAAAAAAGVRRVPWRPGRLVGPWQSAVHVGGADARPHRLRHAGRSGRGQRRALPRCPHLRHQRCAQAQADRRRADLPRLAYAHAGDRSGRQGRTCTSTGPARARSGPPRSSTGCSELEPKEDPNTALFSIDVIQVPLAAPEKARIVNRPRIFADPTSGAIAGLWAGWRPRARDAEDVGDQSVP